MKLNLTCPINGLSYGIVSQNILKELDKEHEVSLFPIQVSNPENPDIISRCIENAKKWDSKSPSIKIWHQNDLAFNVGSPRIAMSFFEKDTLDETEVSHLNNQDMVFLSSCWAKSVASKYLKEEKIKVVPLGVDSDFKPLDIRKRNKCVFFNVNKFEKRKGHDLLPLFFSKAFPKGSEAYKEVELWMMPNAESLPQDYTEYWLRFYSEFENIRILPRVSKDKLITLINSCHCGIFISRAEAWNLPLLEFMACGIKSICTNYSGHTEFCTNDNSYLIEPKGMEEAKDGYWFNGGGSWLNLSLLEDEIIDRLRYVYFLWKNSKIKKDKFCIDTSLKFTWKNTANKIIESLE